jgi:phosphohistidine phosphatase
MKLFLMRHAEPVAGEPNDADRPLTELGRQQIAAMSDFMVQQYGHVNVTIASPFRRALDTAKPMAEALGCMTIRETPWLEPNAPAEKAWNEIETLAGGRDDVLVVTHHPLIGKLFEYLCGAKDARFKHAGIAHLDEKELRWFVDPALVDRTEENAVIEAASKLTLVAAKESLAHKQHADKLKPLRKDAAVLLDKFFAKQLKELLKEIKPKLEALAAVAESAAIQTGRYREAQDTDAQKAAADVIPDDSLPIVATSAMGIDYGKILAAAVRAGYSNLADELGADTQLADDVVEQYLADHSLKKLTGNLDETTVQRLRNALADAYKSGADFDGLKAAVQSTYEQFSSVRSAMIAQTEMNAAYNTGRKHLGLDMGFNEKSWNPDATACIEACLPNVAQGWIGMEDEFLSGDDVPPAHPNCDCSLDIRLNADA